MAEKLPMPDLQTFHSRNLSESTVILRSEEPNHQ